MKPTRGAFDGWYDYDIEWDEPFARAQSVA